MKLVINYDLLEKIFEANHGINLKIVKEESKIFGLVSATPAIATYNQTENLPLAIIDYIFHLAYSMSLGTFFQMTNYKIRKEIAKENLTNLSRELSHYCIETDEDLIKKAKKYKTEYSLNIESFSPQIMQKKYIMVPVHNDWGNNERSLVQEHVIGRREYALSLGEPEEKEKVYSLKPARKFNKN